MCTPHTHKHIIPHLHTWLSGLTPIFIAPNPHPIIMMLSPPASHSTPMSILLCVFYILSFIPQAKGDGWRGGGRGGGVVNEEWRRTSVKSIKSDTFYLFCQGLVHCWMSCYERGKRGRKKGGKGERQVRKWDLRRGRCHWRPRWALTPLAC